jgi:mannosyltransferase OCH1-like enzyme
MFKIKNNPDSNKSTASEHTTIDEYARILFRKLYKATHPNLIDISSLYTEVPKSSGNIPNKVYQTWKSASLPAVHALGVKRFRKINPDYSFIFFDDAAMAAYMRKNYAGHPILEIFEKRVIPASKADIWRYCILYKEGGIYCDIDSSLLIPFRNLLKDNPSELISFEGNPWRNLMNVGVFADPSVFYSAPPSTILSNLEYPDNMILNWLLCFEKEHPILKETIDIIVRNFPFLQGKEFDRLWPAVIHATGPLALTQAVWRWMEKTGQRPNQYGIDFNGKGIFKLPGSGDRYTASPHYFEMKHTSLTEK